MPRARRESSAAESAYRFSRGLTAEIESKIRYHAVLPRPALTHCHALLAELSFQLERASNERRRQNPDALRLPRLRAKHTEENALRLPCHQHRDAPSAALGTPSFAPSDPSKHGKNQWCAQVLHHGPPDVNSHLRSTAAPLYQDWSRWMPPGLQYALRAQGVNE